MPTRQDDLLRFLQDNGYRDVRAIPGVDGMVLCGLQDYLTTRAIVVGLGWGGYERRYCYAERSAADAAIAEYHDCTGHPVGPWIKLKGVLNGECVDVLNPLWIESAQT